MRSTTFSQRSRSRLAGLGAEPAAADESTPPDAPAPAGDPDPPPPSGARGPATPAWLEEPRPAVLGPRPSATPGPDLGPDLGPGLGSGLDPGLDGGVDPDPGPGPALGVGLDDAAATGQDAGRRSRIAGWGPERWRGARFAIGGRGLVVLALVGLVVAAIAGVGVARDQPAAVPVPGLPEVPDPVAAGLSTDTGERDSPGAPGAPGQPGEASGPAVAPEELVVSVQGLVGVSGLVRLEPGARVADAIEAAGGALEGADLHSLNLAQRLGDGDQVLVGVAPTDGGPPGLGSATIVEGASPGAAGSRGAAGAAVGSGVGAGSGGGSGAVNLNTATAADLDALPGVGPVTAQAIVDWRTENGRFSSVDQLSDVRGIGPARLAALRELVTL